jgi:hypothetical protein
MTPTSWTQRWASPAWREEAESWIHDRLADHGIAPMDDVAQPRIRFWSTQLTVPTDRGLMWFKENCPALRAEAAIVQTLTEVAPQHLVPPLGVDPHRGRLLSPDRGETLAARGPTDAETWALVLRSYADLQRRTERAQPRLLAVGMPVLLPADVPQHLEGLAASLPGLPPTSPLRVDAEGAARLRRAAAALRPLVGELAAGPVTPALEHNDLHDNNAFVPYPGEATLRFFDFGDALWAHPFTSLGLPLRLMCRQWGTTTDDPRIQRLLRRYLAAWKDRAPMVDLLRLAGLAARLMPVHRLETWRRVLTDATDQEVAPWAEYPRASLELVMALADDLPTR